MSSQFAKYMAASGNPVEPEMNPAEEIPHLEPGESAACPTCSGSGLAGDGMPCSHCKGTGKSGN